MLPRENSWNARIWLGLPSQKWRWPKTCTQNRFPSLSEASSSCSDERVKSTLMFAEVHKAANFFIAWVLDFHRHVFTVLSFNSLMLISLLFYNHILNFNNHNFFLYPPNCIRSVLVLDDRQTWGNWGLFSRCLSLECQ